MQSHIIRLSLLLATCISASCTQMNIRAKTLRNATTKSAHLEKRPTSRKIIAHQQKIKSNLKRAHELCMQFQKKPKDMHLMQRAFHLLERISVNKNTEKIRIRIRCLMGRKTLQSASEILTLFELMNDDGAIHPITQKRIHSTQLEAKKIIQYLLETLKNPTSRIDDTRALSILSQIMKAKVSWPRKHEHLLYATILWCKRLQKKCTTIIPQMFLKAYRAARKRTWSPNGKQQAYVVSVLHVFLSMTTTSMKYRNLARELLYWWTKKTTSCCLWSNRRATRAMQLFLEAQKIFHTQIREIYAFGDTWKNKKRTERIQKITTALWKIFEEVQEVRKAIGMNVSDSVQKQLAHFLAWRGLVNDNFDTIEQAKKLRLTLTKEKIFIVPKLTPVWTIEQIQIATRNARAHCPVPVEWRWGSSVQREIRHGTCIQSHWNLFVPRKRHRTHPQVLEYVRFANSKLKSAIVLGKKYNKWNVVKFYLPLGVYGWGCGRGKQDIANWFIIKKPGDSFGGCTKGHQFVRAELLTSRFTKAGMGVDDDYTKTIARTMMQGTVSQKNGMVRRLRHAYKKKGKRSYPPLMADTLLRLRPFISGFRKKSEGISNRQKARTLT